MFNKDDIGDKSILEKKYGIVMAGGGAKGAYQAGAIKALSEAGMLDLINFASGSSVGAINMCLLSQDNPTDGIRLWNSISPLDIIDIDVNLIDGKEGFSSREGLVKIISKNVDMNKMLTSKINFYATVSEFSKNNPVPKAKYIYLNEYEPNMIMDILLASSALPVLYEPVDIEGVVYKDGGLTDNLPIKPLYDRGVRNFIVVLLSDTKKVPTENYPDAEFIIIRPSISLGDLITGTLNFSKEEIKLREQLGYYDAIRVLKYYNTPVSKADDFEEFMAECAKNDLSMIKTDIMYDKGQKNFNSNLKKIDNILQKFGINEGLTL